MTSLKVMPFAIGMIIAVCGGCNSAEKRDHADRLSATTRAKVAADAYGKPPAMPTVRIQCSDGNYHYLYTARSEIGGGKCEPKATQYIDFGKGGATPSAYRVNLDRGFIVMGGCFPSYSPIPDRDSSTLPPRPWSPMVADRSIAVAAQGTRFSCYAETDAGGNLVAMYIFRNSGGPVHAWTFAPGTDPQNPGSYLTIPTGGPSPKFILGTKDAMGNWQLSLANLPAVGDASTTRAYFDACDLVAQDWKMNFPNCQVPEGASQSSQ